MERDLEQLNAREVARLLALVETERRYYQEIVASIPVGLLILSADLNIASSNREVRKIFGLRSGEPLRGKVDQFLPTSILEKVREVMASGTAQTKIPVSIPGEPESILKVSIRLIRNWDDDTQQETLLTIEALNGAAARAQATELDETPLPVAGLLDALDAVIWAVDVQSKQFLYINEKAQELLGFPAEKWLETPTFWTDRIYPEDREWMLRGYDQSIEKWARHHCEYRANTSHGRVVWLRESARILQDDTGQPRHLVGLAIDVTQQRLLEGQYVQAQRVEAASRLASRAAHEIANQVMIISGYAEDLLTTLEADSPQQADVREIASATNRLRSLMGQLSLPARTQALSADPIDLNDVLRTMEPHIRASLPAAVQFHLKGFPGSIAVRARSSELRQAISAFIQRARQGLKDGGHITIDCSPAEIDSLLGRPEPTLRPGVYGVIAIEDDGPTMDPQTRLSLFESFVQTPASGDEPGPGLAQIYQWVRQWGGDIAVSTRAPQGSIFQVYLPRIGELPEPPAAARPEAVPVPAEPTTPTGKPKTILVVSEESGIRTLLSKILRREGYQVLEAAGLGEAIRMGTETTGQIDLLIADASLPHMTDSVSVTRMRESSPDIKILLLTATSESDEAQALPEGAESLQKPFTLTALVSKARELLAS